MSISCPKISTEGSRITRFRPRWTETFVDGREKAMTRVMMSHELISEMTKNGKFQIGGLKGVGSEMS
jgi:hypothetical protein